MELARYPGTYLSKKKNGREKHYCLPDLGPKELTRSLKPQPGGGREKSYCMAVVSGPKELSRYMFFICNTH